MGGKKLITICQFGGEFETQKDGTLAYKGGEAHAIDIDDETQFGDFKSEIAEIIKCSADLVSIKYFLLGNKKILITISSDKEFKRMISFNGDSVMVDVYVAAGEIVGNDHSNLPCSRSSRTTLSEAFVPVDIARLDYHNEDAVHTQNNVVVDLPVDLPPVDSVPPSLPFVSSNAKPLDDPSTWGNAITGVRQRFSDVHEFREALRRYAVANKFMYKLTKNDSRRVTVKCKDESCSWRIHASKLSTTPLFCIKTMHSIHTCEGGDVTSGSHAHTTWVAGILKDKLRDSPKYKPKDIIDDVKRNYGIELTYYQAYRGKEMAIEQLRGLHQDAYSQLPLLCEKVLETNPGSFATFATKDDSSFHRLFISFSSSLHGFQQGCRPLLFLDSLPLNSKHQEIFLIATSADGNDGVFPVAFAVVDDETADNWRWFLMELKSSISTSRSITFVADVEKELRESIAEIFENGYHGYCLHYLTNNFRKDLPSHFSNEVKQLLVEDLYAAASSLKVEEFQRSIESIQGISPEAFNWLMSSKPEQWANALFGGAMYNLMTSKFGKEFYSWVSEAYELPITQMVHMIREKMMELINTRIMDSNQWLTRLTPSMEEKLQKETLEADSLELEVSFLPDTDSIFDVRDRCVEKVDIDQWICSCKRWQITGLPCVHAIAVFKCINRSPYDYCSRYFTTESYRLAYSKSINLIPSVDKPMQKDSSEQTVIVTPPPTSRPIRRPKRKHPVSKEVDKQVVDKQVDKRNTRCTKCKVVGHNKATCKEAVEG